MIPSLRDTIIIPINNYLEGIPIIQSNQEGEPPETPHFIFTFITQFIAAGGQPYDVYEDAGTDLIATRIEGFNFTVSFTAISGSEEESTLMCMRLRKWFTIFGEDYLDENALVIDNISDIQNRDSFDEDENRQGFDVTFATYEETSRIIDWFDTIKIGG